MRILANGSIHTAILFLSLSGAKATPRAALACNISQTLPESDTYWSLEYSTDVRCAGLQKEDIFGRLYSLAARYNRFQNTLQIDFNPAADCGSGDGSSKQGCPKDVSILMKSDAIQAEQTCANPDGNPNRVEISQKLTGQIGPFETFRFNKIDRTFLITLESSRATCLIEVKNFKPDTRR